MKIKSLESFYNGVTFRSRLEARWASFFDSKRLIWSYEPDVFETPSGRYLPDFLLPTLECYVEVKPGKGMADRIAAQSVAEQTGFNFLLLESSLVSCRGYDLLVDRGKTWTDTTWCSTEKYLPGGRNEHEHRFFVAFGGDCVCMKEPEWEPAQLREARSLRFNNGVAA